MLRPILLKHRENIDDRQSRYEAAGEQWEQERPGKEMETDNQFGGAGDEREQGGAEWQKSTFVAFLNFAPAVPRSLKRQIVDVPRTSHRAMVTYFHQVGEGLPANCSALSSQLQNWSCRPRSTSMLHPMLGVRSFTRVGFWASRPCLTKAFFFRAWGGHAPFASCLLDSNTLASFLSSWLCLCL
ncbi:hypothetical protein SKAU_G00055890 [Synaphobranchus kaupii]|uniref:Uncharacterized protein n=1 Tax=Synaphobranchus kaupii TaxID=118154 RepID=A0A9Q1G4Z1_SYNKA|nr:hypothetical protein SKAU_G00055890 [Synaphobranchus kaupii]